MALIDLDSPSGNLIDLDTYQEPPKPEGGGFMASVKQAVGAGIKGAGQAASDFIPGVDSDNAVKRYGQEVIDANPTAVRSFGDIGAKPLTAVTEATGNAVGSMGGIIGARALGMGITAAAPLTGPLAPATALLGQAVAWFGPAAMAALPSYGGIRDKQIINDPNNEADWKSKAIAGLGAATVGAIETKFGPQQWALSALTKEGRAALAEKFAETTLAKGIGFGLLKGGSIEGAEELVQSPVEQLASYDDPTTKESLKDTAFGGAMGAIGGGVFGGVTGGIVGRRGEAKPAAAETPPTTPPVDPGAYPSGAPQTDIQQKIDEATGVARPTAGANPFLSETEAAAQQRIKALDEKRAAGTITKILDAPDADSAIANFTASLTGTDMGGILGQANPLIAPAREMQAQAAADQADLADLAQTETRDLNTLRAQLDQESRKQADLDALQATGPGDFDVTKAAVDQAATVEAPTAMQLAMQRAKSAVIPNQGQPLPMTEPRPVEPAPVVPDTGIPATEQSTGTRLDGAPFKSRNGAELRRKANGQTETHEIVQIEGGYVVRPKTTQADAAPTATDAPAPVQPAASGADLPVDAAQPVAGALKRADVEAVTEPIAYADARAMVAGKTEKPGGVDPVRQIDAGEGNRSTYRLGQVPLTMFRQNDGDRYDGTVDRDRAVDYAARDPETMPPIIAVLSPKSGALNVLDGGHRITAARMRGDESILALVSLKPTQETPSVPQANQSIQSQAEQSQQPAGAAPVAEIRPAGQPAEGGAVPAQAEAPAAVDPRLIPVSQRTPSGPAAPDPRIGTVDLTDDETTAEFERLYQEDVKADIRRRLGLEKESADNPRGSAFRTFLRRHGIKPQHASDITGERGFRANNRLPATFRAKGLALDELVLRAVEEGFLTQADIDSSSDNGGTNKLVEMIRGELRGERQVSNQMADDDNEAQMERVKRMELDAEADRLGIPRDADMSTDALALMVSRVLGAMEKARAPKGTLKADRVRQAAIAAAQRIEAKRQQFENELEEFAKAGIAEQNALLEIFMDEDGQPVIVRQVDAMAERAWNTLNGQWEDQNGQADTAEDRPSPEARAPDNQAAGERAGDGAQAGTEAQRGDSEGQSEGLTAPTRADVLRQQAQVETEAQRKEQGGDKPIQRKVTGDTPDMFNTQGSVFDQPAEPEQSAITPAEAGNMSRGDIVRDGKGVEYYAWSARFGRIDVMPLQDGKPVVNNASAIRFALDDATKAANPEYRTDPLYLVRSAPAESEPATQAATILDAANVTGSERLSILKDVKTGALTPNEVQAAFPDAKPAKIDDSGAVLEGARKLYAKAYADKMAEGMEMDLATQPLSKTWPEPDYQRLIDDGADPWAVALSRAVRDEIPNKPSKSWKVKGWVEGVSALRDLAHRAMTGNLTKATLERLAPQHRLSNWANKVDLYEAVGHSASLKGVKFTSGEYGMYAGQTFKPAKTLWTVNKASTSASATWSSGNWGVDLAVGDTKAEAIQKFKDYLAAQGEQAPQQAKATEFDIYSYRGKPGFVIGKKQGKNALDLKTFATAKEAREFLASNRDELGKLLEAAKFVPPERRETNAPRVGIDHRNGADVTNEQFRETFGFRGEQFGASMPQGERQANLNQAYDALMDLAGVVGVPLRALSLNGELGLAFGARGTGGKLAAAAHYERDTTGAVTPNRVVINLTRKNGAGSLAHEWFHAVDNYFARMRGDKAGMMTERPNAPANGVRPEMAQAFKDLIGTINQTGIKARSQVLDNKRTKEYWTTGLEMAARSFESYVIAKLQDQGASNDYLANIVDQTFYALQEAYPYPSMAEMPAIRAAYDHFFDTIQTREDDAGNVAVFARQPGAGIHPDDAKAVVSAIREALPTAPPIHILESVDQAPAELRADIEKAGARDDVDAAYHNGEIYVFPNNIASIERMQFVLAHHEIRHHGLRSILGPKMNAVMLKIHESNPNIRALADEQVRKGYAKSRILATEEALADMPVAELVKLNGWDKIVAAVREWLRGAAARLRRAGLAGVADAIDAKEWTDKDVAALIARAEGVSRGGSARYASDGTVFGKDDAQDTRRGTEDQARAAGFTMKAYRGVSKANPFNDSGTTWLTTDRAVAEAYAEEVMGYEDPDVLTVMIKPDGLPRNDASRLTDEQREAMQSDGFGNPQAIGIYDRSDDHPLGGSRRNVTVIHAPREAVWTVDDGAFARTGSQTSTPAFLKWFGKSKVVNPDGSPMVVYHGTYGDFDTFKRRTGDIGLHFGDADTASDRVATAVPHRGNKDGKTLSANVMPVYLSIKNPLRMEDSGFWNIENMAHALRDKFPQDEARIGNGYNKNNGLQTTKDIREFLQAKGYDGVVYKNTGEVPGSAPFRERIASARASMLKVFPKGQSGFDLNDQKVPEYIAWSEAERAYREHRNTAGTDSYIAFNPTQVKSTIGNNGDFSATNPDIRFARSAVTGQTSRQHTPEQLRAMKNVGFQVEVPTLKERAQALWKDAGKKMAQGIVDQFAPVKDLDKDAYALMRLAKGASGAFESFLHGGKLKLTDNVYDFDEANKGGVIESLLIPLQGEHHDFMRWVAANRAERLAGEGKENLFSAQDIIDLKTLATGTVPFDYTVKTGPAAGRVTRDRAMIYADSLRVFNGFNKNILDMAEQSGLIDPESRKLWEHEFYVPFYRVADESDGGIRGANIKGGVVRQAAFKQLKGGKNALNADLLDNTLMNWAHLLDAAAKNRAAKAAIEAAERMGVAAPGNQSTLAQMATSINNKHGVVWFMDGGQKRYSLVDDPFLMTAISSLEYAGMRNPVMNAMSTFKHALTIGVTASPFFKIRNLIRDSVQVIGTSSINPNPLANIGNGWKLTNPKSDEYFRLLAGGGTIHFGTMLEGSEAKRVQALVESGVDDATILGDQNKVKQFYRRYIEPGITAYNELGNRGEAINRASLYDQLRKQGASHADASLQARDLMDFSMQGTFTTIRFLTQVVPFLNARLQGLYKLGRGAKEDPSRFSAVVGAAAVMSIALLAAYGDDDDWKKRTEDDRNNWFWFKFGGIAFRIPRPFEIGAIATLAERSFELAFEKEMTGERFRKQIVNLLGDNLSMNPIPQMVKPILDVYANKNSFTGAPIESMGQQRLKPEYRFNERTSMTARAASTGINSITGLVGADGPSPVQIDHMLRGYFGWLGAFVVGAGDVIARPATDQPKQATPDYWKVITGGMAADLRDAPSRYVSAMYDQAKVVGEAYATHRQLLKEGKVDEAREFADENKDDLVRYRVLNRVKGQEAKLNERKRMIERSNMDADTKRATLRMISDQQNNLAKQLAMQ